MDAEQDAALARNVDVRAHGGRVKAAPDTEGQPPSVIQKDDYQFYAVYYAHDPQDEFGVAGDLWVDLHEDGALHYKNMGNRWTRIQDRLNPRRHIAPHPYLDKYAYCDGVNFGWRAATTFKSAAGIDAPKIPQDISTCVRQIRDNVLSKQHQPNIYQSFANGAVRKGARPKKPRTNKAKDRAKKEEINDERIGEMSRDTSLQNSEQGTLRY